MRGNSQAAFLEDRVVAAMWPAYSVSPIQEEYAEINPVLHTKQKVVISKKSWKTKNPLTIQIHWNY